MDVSANASQFVEFHVVEVVQHNSRRFQNEIMCSGQTFPNTDAFRDVVYLMSIARRFWYYYKKNCFKHMTVICTVNDCPWKITYRAVGALYLVQVHTFVNEHRHIVDDLVSTQPLVRCNQASKVIDDIIRCIPEYMPRQICKDFIREHAKNFYKLLLWMCERIKKCYPASVVELTTLVMPFIAIDLSYMSGPYGGALFFSNIL